MRRLVAVAVTSLVLGCGSPPPSPSHEVPRSTLAGGGDTSLPIAMTALQGAPQDAPVVATRRGTVSINDTKVADIDMATTKPRRIEALSTVLQKHADAWRRDHPDASSSAKVALWFERDTTAGVVKSVLISAAHAGVAHVSLLVRLQTPDNLVPGYVDVGITSKPAHEAKPERELHLRVAAHGAVILKWEEGPMTIGEPVASEALFTKLAPIVDRSWGERGMHRDPNDRRFDQAIVHADNDAAWALLVVAVDAARASKRGANVSAMNVSIAAD